MDLATCEATLRRAFSEGRTRLTEKEAYDLLETAKVLQGPKRFLFQKGQPFDSSKISSDRAVLKIQHPDIIHKSDVGGVEFVSKDEISKAAEKLIERHGASATVLVCEEVSFEHGLGQETLLGMQETRDFGPILTFAAGGLQTEYLSHSMKEGLASISWSPTQDVHDFLGKKSSDAKLFPLDALTGRIRGVNAVADEASVLEILSSFSELVRHFSSQNSKAPFYLSTFEINPMVVSKGTFLALDAFLEFDEPKPKSIEAPTHKIRNLLYPKSVCLVGVSKKRVNPARQILKNLQAGVIGNGDLAIIKKGVDEIDGVRCYPSLRELPGEVDLLVLAAQAKEIPQLLDECIENQVAESILLISGGLGEKADGKTLEAHARSSIRLSRARPDKGPVLVGGNSLGVISHPGGINTLFVPESKLPLNPDHPIGHGLAFISQSGAFAISRMNRLGSFCPDYLVSTGNQMDLGVGDFIETLADDPLIQTIACYVEGFRENEGQHFLCAASKAIEEGKNVVVYKAGRNEAGKKAASGHTAAIAGNWDIAREVLSHSGCLFAESFEEFTDLMMLASLLSGKQLNGFGVGAVSNAGFEAVGISDQCKHLHLSEFTAQTKEKISTRLQEHKLSDLQDVRNPMDLTPMASDQVHAQVLESILEDENVHLLIHALIPLTPALKTRAPGGPEGQGIDDPDSFAGKIAAISKRTKKPLVFVLDAGLIYQPLAEKVLLAGIPVLPSADRSARMLEKYVLARGKAETKIK